jgi:hypothetical protein
MDTTRMISNVRVVHKDGAYTAQLKYYELAQHFPPGKGTRWPKLLMAGEYDIDLERDEAMTCGRFKKWHRLETQAEGKSEGIEGCSQQEIQI